MANGIVLNIDTTKSEFQNPMVQLRQGDGNYQSLAVTVTSNGEPFDLTGWTTTFMGTTAGGFKIIDSAVAVTNVLQGEFTYTPTKAWGQNQGEFKNAYFKFTKVDETASGASFRVNVLDAVDLTAEEAGEYISIVDQTIGKLTGDLSTLQTSVDQLKAQNNNIKTTDNTWTGTNTFNNKIIATAGVQGNADTATKLQTPIIIGGRNLFLNSMVLSDGYGTNGSMTTVTVESFDSTTNMWHIVSPQNNGTGVGICFFGYADNKMATNSYWSYSADIKGTGLPVNFGIESLRKNTISGNVASDWSRISQTGYAVGNPKHVVMYFDTSNSPLDVYIKLPKLESGNIPTDWTPAPEDVPSNDSNLVHKTGTETIAGNKTFTGNNTFTQNISGNLTGNSDTTTKLQTPRKINGTNFDGTADINVNAANDSNLVHLTGNETIAGSKTFTGNNTFTGQTSFWFKQIQWTSGIMQGTWYIQRIGNWVNAKFDMSADTSTGTTTLTLPVGYRPLSPFVRELEQGTAGIAKIGTVFIGQVYTGANAMTFSYPTNDVWPTA